MKKLLLTACLLSLSVGALAQSGGTGSVGSPVAASDETVTSSEASAIKGKLEQIFNHILEEYEPGEEPKALTKEEQKRLEKENRQNKVAMLNQRSWENFYDQQLSRDIYNYERWVYNEMKTYLSNLGTSLMDATAADLGIMRDIDRAEILKAFKSSQIKSVENAIRGAVKIYQQRVIYPKVRFRTFNIIRASRDNYMNIGYGLEEPFVNLDGTRIPSSPYNGLSNMVSLYEGQDYRTRRFDLFDFEPKGYEFIKRTQGATAMYIGAQQSFYFGTITMGLLPYGAYKQLINFLQTVSEECPVKVTIDTQTRLITKFKFACDPYRP